MNPEKTTEVLTKADLAKIRRLEKKQARRVAAEELKKKCVWDHLKREQQFSLETEKRSFKDWERMCSELKNEELLEEMRQLEQNFKLIFDRKNNYIDRLFGDRAEMENIFGRNLHRLKRLINCYMEIYQFYITNLSRQYQEDCKSRLNEFNNNIKLKESQAEEVTEQMEGALISLEDAMQQGLEDDRIKFIKKNDENINFHIEKRDRLRDKNVQQMEQLYTEIKNVSDNYFTTVMHPDMEQAYQNLTDEDRKSRNLIQSNRSRCKQLSRQINCLNKKITEAEVAGARKVISKRFVKRKLEVELDNLKRKINHMESEMMDRMKVLAYDVFHVQKHLKSELERGRLILGLAKTCSKYECEDDIKYNEKLLKRENSLGDFSSDGSNDLPTDFKLLFDKIKRVKAINLLLREERDQLLETNHKLQHQFKKYCQLNSPEVQVAKLHLKADKQK